MKSVYINPALTRRYSEAWQRCRLIFFSAPCGCGKTTTAQALTADIVTEFRNAAEPGLLSPPGNETEAVVLDDIQLLSESSAQEELSAFIRRHQTMHFLLLSRGPVPGWLIPFQYSGMLESFDIRDLLLDAETSRELLTSGGVFPDPIEMSAINRDIKGYALPLVMLRRHMSKGGPYSEEMLQTVIKELYSYLDEAVFKRFDKPLRNLLICVSPFERFTAEMAKIVSGDPRTGELLGRLLRETSMLALECIDVYEIYPIFRNFLVWEASQTCTLAETQAVYNRAGLYYELEGDIPHALDCYSRGKDAHKVTELLEKHAQIHPGAGHYYEVESYYLSQPREEVMRSPALMCGMSMLSAMTMDFDASESWYEELRRYMSKLRRTDNEYREVRGKIAYLDIALPQRGSGGLIELIATVFHVMSDKEMVVPAFSVTSTLPSIMNGGKDFCNWSKKDDLLYVTMRKPVETVLGRDGVGLADCAICESKFEKGANVTDRLLNLVAHLGEIQTKGTPDIEFAVIGLLARDQTMRGEADSARKALLSFRERMESAGEDRFLPNIDAMICRLDLRSGDIEAVQKWKRENAASESLRLRALWRYRYLTLAMVDIMDGNYDDVLLLLSPLESYCEKCGRTMDLIYKKILNAICFYRMGSSQWEDILAEVLGKCLEYRFITPVSQFGAAILPLLKNTGWHADASFRDTLISAARVQAVNYPLFMKNTATLEEPLTATEEQVLRLLCHDLTNNEIGEILDIKLPTVKTHVSHILQKLGVSRRSEAKAAAEKLHLI